MLVLISPSRSYRMSHFSNPMHQQVVTGWPGLLISARPDGYDCPLNCMQFSYPDDYKLKARLDCVNQLTFQLHREALNHGDQVRSISCKWVMGLILMFLCNVLVATVEQAHGGPCLLTIHPSSSVTSCTLIDWILLGVSATCRPSVQICRIEKLSCRWVGDGESQM